MNRVQREFCIIEEAKKVFDIEMESLQLIKEELGQDFKNLVQEILECSGRVIITGMGKSGHIGKKIVATMASLGIPSYFVHPGEGVHGDLGMITKEDIVLAISNSGETEEVLQLIPSIKKIGSKLVSITSKRNSSLENYADISIKLNIGREACEHNLAPTTSTTATLVFGDALAVVLSKMIGFKPEDFAIFHPKGALGKRLLTRVDDLMHTGDNNPVVSNKANIKEAVIQISAKGLGAINVVNEENVLVGIITDGDVRRTIEKYDNLSGLSVDAIMTQSPIVTNPDVLAVEALKIMENRKNPIMVLPVVDEENKSIGMIRLHDIVKAGIA